MSLKFWGWSRARLVNSVEITENSVKFSNLKNSVKFSTESFSRSLKLLNFTEITEIFILTSERWEIHPKLYLNYNFCTISRKINLNLGKRGGLGLGGWRMRSRKFFGKFPKTWEKFPRKFREISGKRTGFTEI